MDDESWGLAFLLLKGVSDKCVHMQQWFRISVSICNNCILGTTVGTTKRDKGRFTTFRHSGGIISFLKRIKFNRLKMTSNFILFLIIVTLAVVKSEVVDSFRDELKIVNGNLINIKDRPYQVGIHVQFFIFFVQCTCGGTIISDKYVLTAAHCVDREDTYFLRMGSERCLRYGVVNVAKTITIHPLFKRDPYTINDMAVIETVVPIKFTEFIQPIAMADKDFDAITLNVEITGYGRLCLDCDMSELLEKIDETILKYTECKKYRSNVLPNMYCHKDVRNISTTCTGDSGGPVTVVTGGQKILVGITSYGYDCAANDIGISSSIPAFRDWIRSVTNI
ncbi:Trypsin-7 [Pseudolycoriella hygida]|uniref:Trypsin-7 n=1 Tax=Pseudolycoriella hygida TaxID=35572 RepID=A0A9Q0NEW4_9DIPT|nr:Trypsin-7 [Pseudolycoriella hygida]